MSFLESFGRDGRIGLTADSVGSATDACAQHPIVLAAELVLNGPFSDSNLATFRGWEKLKLIHLNGTLVSANGLRYLLASENLERIELHGPILFSLDQVQSIADQFPDCDLIDFSDGWKERQR